LAVHGFSPLKAAVEPRGSLEEILYGLSSHRHGWN
jgi:hypothetical protein